MKYNIKMEGNGIIQINPEKSTATRYGALKDQWLTFELMKPCVSLIQSPHTSAFNSHAWLGQTILSQPHVHARQHLEHTSANPKTHADAGAKLRSSSPASPTVAPPRNRPEIHQTYTVRLVFSC